MLDELRDLFLRALKFDSKDKFDRIPLIREWNEAIDHVQEAFDRMTDKDPRLVEVRHGRWIKDGEDGPVYCSECGEEHEWEDFRASYCDTCGAKMDGGQDNE